jgi:hypothetical protein
MSEIIILVYSFFALVFIGGITVVIYHLLTFKLSKTLATMMTAILVTGGIILLGINIYYFSKVDWQSFFTESYLL